jgi:hypothetical protein
MHGLTVEAGSGRSSPAYQEPVATNLIHSILKAWWMMQSRYDAHFGSTNLGYKLRFQVVNIYTVCMMDPYEHLSLKK